MSELANTTGQLEFNTMCRVASQCVWTLWCVSLEMKDEIWEPLKHDIKTFWEGFFWTVENQFWFLLQCAAVDDSWSIEP